MLGRGLSGMGWPREGPCSQEGGNPFPCLAYLGHETPQYPEGGQDLRPHIVGLAISICVPDTGGAPSLTSLPQGRGTMYLLPGLGLGQLSDLLLWGRFQSCPSVGTVGEGSC